ncbi:Peptidyl-prolyl isomerase cwc27, partial [Ascosphaera atra]
GTERPVYPVQITGCSVDDLGPFSDKLKKRNKIAVAEEPQPVVKKRKKSKQSKVKLNFLEDDGDEEIADVKPKFNTRLVVDSTQNKQQAAQAAPEKQARKDAVIKHGEEKEEKPMRSSSDIKKPDPSAQLPLPDPEVPRRSQSRESSKSPTPPPRMSKLERTQAEIESLKASMRRDVDVAPEAEKPKSALEAMIPVTAIRGRKRPAANGNGGGDSSRTGGDSEALKMLNAFKAKLDQADHGKPAPAKKQQHTEADAKTREGTMEQDGEEEEQVCDLHFIANCQSCRAWDQEDPAHATAAEDDNAMDWMSHALSFGKDMLGKDITWKRKNEDADNLMVIDPREKEKELLGKRKGKDSRDGERKRKIEKGGEREWDRDRRR